jgi:iron complex transport system ATP-binding protein
VAVSRDERDPILSLNDVSFAYEGPVVLEQVSIALRRGESVGILGENGSGKSTLLRLMAGLIRPDRGEVSLFGRDIGGRRRMDIARMIAVVGQGVEPIFDFPVQEAVLMGRNPHIPLFGGEGPEDREKAEAAMERMGILEIRKHPVTGISAGELQRVMIARALAQETPILLLDEPTSALDVRHQIALVGVLRTLLAEEGRTIVTVSHDIDLIAHLCERVVLIGGRTVLADGPVDEMIHPARLYEVYGVRMEIDRGSRGVTIRIPWESAGPGGEA